VAATRPLSPKDFTELESQCRRHVLLFIGQEDQIHDLLFRLRPKSAHKSRRHMRYKAALPVYFQFCTETGAATDEALHQGASIDISEGGFQVEGEAIPNLTAETVERQNLHVRLAFKLDGQELHMVCAVRFVKAWMRTNEHVFPWVYGFELKRIEEGDRALLRNLCIRAGIVMRRDKTFKFT
jgi:c-di-GMP-binding flagellar brake protein YcgR